MLYQMRGFDTAATALRAPFRLTLDVRLDIGRPMAEQQLDKWLRPGRAGRPGPRLTADELAKRYARNVPDPYKAVLQESDSLLLTRPQSDSLTAAQTRYRARVDSLWAALAAEFAALGDRYDGAAALKRQEATVDAAWELSRRDVQAALPRILSPVQLRLLPWPAGMLYRERAPIKGLRVFMAG